MMMMMMIFNLFIFIGCFVLFFISPDFKTEIEIWNDLSWTERVEISALCECVYFVQFTFVCVCMCVYVCVCVCTAY